MTSSPNQRLKEAKLYLAERAARNPALTPSRTFVNSTQKQLYTGNSMGGARAGDDQHMQILSAPMAAQIRRV